MVIEYVIAGIVTYVSADVIYAMSREVINISKGVDLDKKENIERLRVIGPVTFLQKYLRKHT